MDKRDLCFRHPGSQQLSLDVIVDIEGTIIFRGREVAEQKLGQLVFLSFRPNTENIPHAGIDFAAGIIRQQRVHQPLVKANLPAIRSNLEHIVFGSVHFAAVYSCRPFGEALHHLLLELGGLHHHGLELGLRHRQVQLISGLNVRHFLEDVH